MAEEFQIIEQSLQAVRDGDALAAIGLIDQALAAGPSVNLLFTKADILRSAGLPAESENLLTQMLAVGVISGELCFRLGMARASQGKWAEAEEALAQAVAQQDDHANAWFYLALSRMQQGQYERAEPASRRAAELQQDHLAPWTNLAECLQRLGKPDEAIVALERAMAVDSSAEGVRHSLLQAYVDALRFGEAQLLVSRLSQAQPEDAWWSGAMPGWLCRAMGHENEAVPYLRRAVSLAPDIGDFYCKLGLTLRQTRQFEDAHFALSRAAQLEPNSVDAHLGLAGVSLDQGHYAEALREVESFEANRPALALPKRSVVIAVLDYSPGSSFNIRTLLEDLATFDGEVICVFNGDECFSELKDHPRIDKYALNKYNAGVSRGWNMGINLAEGDTIHILNADLKISVEMLYRLEHWVQTLPDALCVGVSAHWMDFTTLKETDRRADGQFSEPLACDLVSGQLMTLHAGRLHDAHISFDPRLAPYFSEEVDLGLKARHAGYKIYAVPETDFQHSWGISRRDRPILYFGRPVNRLRCFVYNQALVGHKAKDLGMAMPPPAKKKRKS